MKKLWLRYWFFLLLLLAMGVVGFDLWVDGLPEGEGYEKGFIAGLALGWIFKGIGE